MFIISYIHNDEVMTSKTGIANTFKTFFTNTVKTHTTALGPYKPLQIKRFDITRMSNIRNCILLPTN